ncbi:unnamed protein product [Coregonus sp. 'balchen']|nr:unnamed protein product [Coregonus sp. 'balchen']
MRAEAMFILVLHTILSALLVSDVSATLSRTDAKKKDSKTQEPETSQAEQSVLERGLVVADPQWKDIVKEERRYCQRAVTKHTFQGPVLGYITPVSAVLDLGMSSHGS